MGLFFLRRLDNYVKELFGDRKILCAKCDGKGMLSVTKPYPIRNPDHTIYLDRKGEVFGYMELTIDEVCSRCNGTGFCYRHNKD